MMISIHQIRTIFRERRKYKQEIFCLLYWCLRIFKTTLSKCDSQEPNVATFFDHYFLVENEKCETWESHNCKIRSITFILTCLPSKSSDSVQNYSCLKFCFCYHSYQCSQLTNYPSFFFFFFFS